MPANTCVRERRNLWALLGIAVLLIPACSFGQEDDDASETTASADESTQPKRLLTADDFRYLGRVAVVGMGWSTHGLAYRPETDTWLTVEKTGRFPLGLHEFSMPEPTLPPAPPPHVKHVRAWGPLGRGKGFAVKGQLISLRGLWWDADHRRLWFNFGSFYASGVNNPVIGSATLDGNKLEVQGPWYVPESVHADTVKGMLFPAPPELRKITGQRLLAFGVRGSTAQLQSWGAGLVSIAAPPLAFPAGQELRAIPLIHWPLQMRERTPYSDFPRLPGDKAVIIKGNENAGRKVAGAARDGTENSMTLARSANYPENGNTLVGCYLTNLETDERLKIVAWNNTTKVAITSSAWTRGIPKAGTPYEIFGPSYEPNHFVPDGGKYCASDGLISAAWIDLPDREGLLYFGATTRGYVWYGNQTAHNDTTPEGKTFSNSLKSLLRPEEELTSTFEGRGWHAEEYASRWYLIDPRDVMRVAAKAVAHAASPADLQISWKLAGDVTTLGGSVDVHARRFCQMFWNRDTRRLSVLTLAEGEGTTAEIHVWEIGGESPTASNPG